MEDKLFDLVSEYKPQGDQPKAIKGTGRKKDF